jgi:uncharacterized protein YjbI with pentapeptide repeats
MKIEIKHRHTAAVLFAHDVVRNTMRLTVEAAVSAKADLSGSNLRGSDLRGSNLRGSNLRVSDLRGSDLRGSDLRGSDLRGSDLSGSNLRYSNLSGSDLSGSDLRGSDLSGSDLSGSKLSGSDLSGDRPILQIGPIGSRADFLIAYLTDTGIMIRAGCWYGTRGEFAAAVVAEHDDNVHAREYRAALAMIDAHAALWTPATPAV